MPQAFTTFRRPQEVIELNLAQCANAYENLYFASAERVQATIDAFRSRSDALRPARPTLRELPLDLQIAAGFCWICRAR